MPIDLTRFERGAPFAGDFHAELGALQRRIAALHLAQVVHGRRSIILFEGWVGSGKKDALRRLVAALDPCKFNAHCIDNQRDSGKERHWLAPFWAALPEAEQSSLFYRSWYTRAVVARISGLSDKGWARMLDEINEFENQQRDHGTVIVKIFMHVSAQIQREQVEERLKDSWRQHLLSHEDIDRIRLRPTIEPIVSELFDHTDTRWAPWHVVDAGDRRSGQIAALRHIADCLAKGLPAEPPAEVRSAEILDFRAAKRV